ncbi:MAG: undecaprenyl-diphosphate phosphatase [Clostridia bacterium]|nr:undecaprenyl-diphosphate phosphatase [Clostridia bacterium]
MTIFEAIIQGIVQGLTEFLPVSSSGHLSLSQHILGVQLDSLLFDILLHLGTLLAVCAVYYKLFLRLIRAFFRLIADVFRGRFKWKDMDEDRRLLIMLVIGLLPLFLLFVPVPGTGMDIKDLSEQWSKDTNLWVEGFAFLATSVLLFLGIRAMKRARPHTVRDGKGTKEIKGRTKLRTADAVTIGLTQCCAAVFPGLSRSGSTLCSGLLRGVNQQTALDYSFVMGTPSILAAAVLTIGDAANEPVNIGIGVMIAGVLTAAVVGFLAIKLLKWIVTTNKLEIFAYYTLVLGAVTIVVSIIETISGQNICSGLPL